MYIEQLEKEKISWFSRMTPSQGLALSFLKASTMFLSNFDQFLNLVTHYLGR